MRYLIGLFICISSVSVAQKTLTESDYSAEYKKAVQAIVMKDYDRGKNLLTPLIARKYKFSTTPFALYYHALSSLKLRKGFEARLILQQLFDRYPDWSKSDEAYYLYADANFLDAFYENGLSALNKIENKLLQSDALEMCYFYFKKLKINELKWYNKQYPQHAGVALALIRKIQESEPKKEDLELSDKLVRLHKLGQYLTKTEETKENATASKSGAFNTNSENLNVGLLLPFDLSVNKRNISEASRYIYEYYDGMLFAQNKLISEQVFINLFTFDVSKTAHSVQRLIDVDDLQKMHLVLGPIYSESNDVLTHFLKGKKIFQVHPFSNNGSLTVPDQSFLAQPSNATIANLAVDFFQSKDPSSEYIIVYGPTKKDSLLSVEVSQILVARGYESSSFKSSFFDKTTVQNAPKWIFYACSDPSVFQKSLPQIERKYPYTKVLTNAVTDEVSSKKVYFINSEYINFESEDYKAFKQSYFNKRGKVPSYYATLGYDHLLFYGRNLQQYRNLFPISLNLFTNQHGLLGTGFNYSASPVDNQVLPIGQFEEGRFIISN